MTTSAVFPAPPALAEALDQGLIEQEQLEHFTAMIDCGDIIRPLRPSTDELTRGRIESSLRGEPLTVRRWDGKIEDLEPYTTYDEICQHAWGADLLEQPELLPRVLALFFEDDRARAERMIDCVSRPNPLRVQPPEHASTHCANCGTPHGDYAVIVGHREGFSGGPDVEAAYCGNCLIAAADQLRAAMEDAR